VDHDADILATIAIPLAITPAHAAHAALGSVIVIALVLLVFLVGHRLSELPQVRYIRKEGERRQWARFSASARAFSCRSSSCCSGVGSTSAP
jgi:hypothetical protein